MAKAIEQKVVTTQTKVVLELEPEEAVALCSVVGRISGRGARDITSKIFTALEGTRYAYSKHQDLYRHLTRNGYDDNESNLSFREGSIEHVRSIVAEADALGE